MIKNVSSEVWTILKILLIYNKKEIEINSNIFGKYWRFLILSYILSTRLRGTYIRLLHMYIYDIWMYFWHFLKIFPRTVLYKCNKSVLMPYQQMIFVTIEPNWIPNVTYIGRIFKAICESAFSRSAFLSYRLIIRKQARNKFCVQQFVDGVTEA